MASGRDEGPVYYREIQKNAYLKRIPNEIGGSKLRPLGLPSKKVPLKPMWTQFCVHNGRTPYLEQYPEADSPATITHKPIWRACLRSARHVTASVKPHCGQQYDFLVDTDNGAVRMLAPDWESMQDWVTTLRNTLHELKILSRGENVYCAHPAPPPPPPPPRAAARDPTSPLPPTPPIPPDRVPGIELTPTPRIEPQPEPQTQPQELEPTPRTPPTPQEDIDISNWDTPFSSLPSTSISEPRTSVAKICGQNICLDDSLFKRTNDGDDDDEFGEDKMEDDEEFKQRVVVSNGDKDDNQETSNNQATNVTVIKVSNKDPPHTAIPVMGPETNVFNFEFKQNVTITEQPTNPNFVNIVNTEQNEYGTTFSKNDTEYGTTFSKNDSEYGTTFSKNDSEYGHLSLTTTVNLTGTSEQFSNFSSPNSNSQTNSNFPSQANVNIPSQTNSNFSGQNSNFSGQNSNFPSQKEGLYERLCMASTSNPKPSPLPVKKLKNVEKSRKSSLPNLENLEVGESTYEYLFLSNNNAVTVNSEVNCNGDSRVQIVPTNDTVNRLRAVERSRSQNAYDSAPRTRENAPRTQNGSPKRETKNENTEHIPQNKPIWKRGLTELSLLTRLRSITQKKESPTRQEDHERSPAVTSPVKVVHRSRPEGRVDSTRRRSSSLSNGQSPPRTGGGAALTPLRARQARALRAEQRRGAALVASVPVRDAPVFTDYDNQVWIAWWGGSGVRAAGRSGDRVAALRGRALRDAAHARQLLLNAHAHSVDILFHRVPLAKIYVVNKRDQESLGLKLDGECNIIGVEANSACGRAGLPPPGAWALTEINNRPINLLKGGEDDMNRLSKHGTEVSILIQPSALVKKLRSALKGNKALLGLR